MAFTQEKFRSPQRSAPLPFEVFQYGLHVRVAHPSQPSLFGPRDLTIYERATELCSAISRLRFRDFRLKAQLERAGTGLLASVASGFWVQAERAALDIAELLASAGRRRVAHPETCSRGERFAYRILDSIEREVHNAQR
jgi:hypothetical protein